MVPAWQDIGYVTGHVMEASARQPRVRRIQRVLQSASRRVSRIASRRVFLAFSLPFLPGLSGLSVASAQTQVPPDTTALEPAGAPLPRTSDDSAPRTDVDTTGAAAAVGADGAPASPPADIRRLDAHADRVVLLPTAETHPAGTVYLSLYEIIIPQVGVAVSDRTQITFTTTPPFGEDLAFLSDLTLKTVVVRHDRVRVAALGSVLGAFGLESDNFLLGRVGAVVQGCFDAECLSSASLGSTVVLAGPATLTANAAGMVWRVTTALSLLLEVQTLLPLGREAGGLNGIAVAPGLRLGWSRFAVDLAVELLPEAEIDGASLPRAIPFLAATYRFLSE
jgi:hypothetical protein